MASEVAPRPLAAFLGDVIGSRASSDRKGLHDTLTSALATVSAEVDTVDDIQVTAGDEFQGTFANVGEALYAALLLRLRLTPHIDVRIGVGWGDVTVLDAAHGTQDGPAWWAARAAIEWIEKQQASAGWQSVRTAYRRADIIGDTLPGPTPEAVSAALLCQDHLMGLLDERSRHILEGLMHGQTQVKLAEELGLTRQAVNQRRKQDGLAILVAAAESLRTLE
ncbi:SatD family protein [Ornithinimicrobium faecis]|uniref:SatD family protein n=1 Tax=Ornithinimicrobium faecis TaxID=2934158 RepID=A0ABY4YQA6_9MICO|nr:MULTISPECIES: SatD family protein [unclassified Ornithinimicrobium]USQ78884.1 SatD family protein [Ornithinimicrobium sp. HY1793]